MAALATALAAALCWHMLGAIPHVPDEVAYAFQGRLFAMGRLWLPPPELPEAFRVYGILTTPDRWCAIYPPGWPLLLALGWLARAPWLVNPLLFGLAVIGVQRLAARLFDARTASVACVLFAASPFVLLMSSGFMSHPATLCCAVWCAVLLQGEGRRRWLGAGALAGLCFLIRPVSAAALLAPFALESLFRLRLRSLWCVAGALPFAVLFLLYDAAVFGSPWRTGYDLWPDLEKPGLASPAVFAANLPWYVRQIGKSLWGLPPSDWVLFLPLLLPAAGRRRCALLAAPLLCMVLLYSLFEYRDITYSGPRYVFEATAFLSILAARSLLAAHDALPVRAAWPILATLLAIAPVLRLVKQVDHHSHFYHGAGAELPELLEEGGVGEDALVMLAGHSFVFRSFFFENELPPERGTRVIAREVPGLRERYRRRETWRATVRLEALPGPNPLPDAWRLEQWSLERLE